jgi:hypothetical protein
VVVLEYFIDTYSESWGDEAPGMSMCTFITGKLGKRSDGLPSDIGLYASTDEAGAGLKNEGK